MIPAFKPPQRMPNPILDFFLFSSSSEEENRLLTFWLRRIFYIAFGILLGYAPIAFYLKLPSDIFIFVGISLLILIGLLFLLNQGYVRLSSLLLCLGGMAGLFFAAYRYGGVRSTSYNALIIIIILSAMFLRGRIATLATAISVLGGIFLLIAELNGSYQPSEFFLGPIYSWLATSIIFILAGMLVGIAARQVKGSFRQATLEITQRQQIEAELRETSQYQNALHETTLAIINRLELFPLLESILTKAESLANTEHGYIDLVLPDNQSLQQIAGHGLFSNLNGVCVKPGEGIGGLVLQSGKTEVVRNYRMWPNRIQSFPIHEVYAIAAVPMQLGGQVLGIIGLAYLEPEREFSATQLKILNQFAELAALALGNARLYEAAQAELAEHKQTQAALSRSEENLHRALDAASMGIWDWGIDPDVFTWSENIYALFGVTKQNFAGTLAGYLAFVHPGDRPRVKNLFETCLKEPNQIFSSEHRILRPDGSVGWIEGKGIVRTDETGKAIHMTGTLADITKRKDDEQALFYVNQKLKADTLVLERRSTLLQVAAEVSRAASAILDPNTLGQAVVELVRKRFNAYYVGLFLLDESGKSAVLRAGTGKAGREMLKHGHHFEVGSTSMVGWCVANQHARIALDVGKDAVHFDNPWLPKTRSEWVLPLISRGQILGALTIQSKKEAAFSNEDIETFQTMADQLANAILNARLYDQLERELEERKQVEETIRQLNTKLEDRVRRRTAALKASEEKFRALSENNPLQVTRYDREGRYLYVNRGGKNDLLPPQQAIGKKLGEVLAADPTHLEFIEACLRQVFETGQPMNTEYALDNYYALWSLAPEFDTQGNVMSVIASTQDITERKRMEEELHQRSLDLQAANKELEAFSYSVSHDLRAPLRAIAGFSRILKDEFGQLTPEETNEYLQKISKASLNMGQLIDDILRLSRITRSELRENLVDLGALAKTILDDIRSHEPERPAEIEIQPNLWVRGDERLLSLALENLLSNAWKFTGKTERTLIHVGSKLQDGQKIFFIRDNGVGFEMAYADKLFGAFQRLHTAEEFPGTGIGLAIVQRVIHKHGGQIWAESKKDQGTTFYFSI